MILAFLTAQSFTMECLCILVHKVGPDQNFQGQYLGRPEDAQGQVLIT